MPAESVGLALPASERANRKRCVSYFTLRWLSKKCKVAKPRGIGDHLGPGHSVLSFWSNRSSFLIGELLLGNLSETVVVVGNAPHNRPGFLVGHLIGNRASFLCTKAPMRRIQNEVSGHQLTSTSVPLTEKGPSRVDGQGKLAERLEVEFGPFRPAASR